MHKSLQGSGYELFDQLVFATLFDVKQPAKAAGATVAAKVAAAVAAAAVAAAAVAAAAVAIIPEIATTAGVESDSASNNYMWSYDT